jgi:hypothetical protein
MTNVSRLLATVAAFLLSMGLAWYGGIDFGERGVVQAFSVGYSVVVAGLTFTCPVWRKQK